MNVGCSMGRRAKKNMVHIPYHATRMKTTSERESSSIDTTKLAMKKAEEGRPHLGGKAHCG